MTPTTDRLVYFSQLKPEFNITYSRMSLWRLEREGRFPKRIILGGGRICWSEHEIRRYIEDAKARRLIEEKVG